MTTIDQIKSLARQLNLKAEVKQDSEKSYYITVPAPWESCFLWSKPQIKRLFGKDYYYTIVDNCKIFLTIK